MRVFVVFNQEDADKLNKFLEDNPKMEIVDSNTVKYYRNDDMGTIKKKGVAYTLNYEKP